MKFTEEQIAKMKAATSAEELIALAKAEGIEATEEEIKAQFDAMHKEGEIADEELNNVAGGSICDDPRPPKQEMAFDEEGRVICPFCKLRNFTCMTWNTSDPYDRLTCKKCGRSFRHYWKGDEWTQD